MTSQSTPIINHYSALITIDNLDNLEKCINTFINRLDLHVVKRVNHLFKPVGETIIYILSESHLAIHTWPEKNMIHIDLVSCSGISKEKFDTSLDQSFNPKKCTRI